MFGPPPNWMYPLGQHRPGSRHLSHLLNTWGPWKWTIPRKMIYEIDIWGYPNCIPSGNIVSTYVVNVLPCVCIYSEICRQYQKRIFPFFLEPFLNLSSFSNIQKLKTTDSMIPQNRNSPHRVIQRGSLLGGFNPFEKY